MRVTRTLMISYVLSFTLAGAIAIAQAPAPGAAVPALDPASKAKLDTVQRAASLANTSCQALDAVKVYADIRALVQTDLEAKFPGFTVAWDKFVLIPKAVAEKK